MRNSHIYITVVLLWVIGAAGFAVAERPAKTKGPIPKEAVDEASKHYKYELIPDYIAVLNRKGKAVGYVRKEDWQDTNRRADGVIEVLDEDLDKTVGHMVPNQGFVALEDQQ